MQARYVVSTLTSFVLIGRDASPMDNRGPCVAQSCGEYSDSACGYCVIDGCRSFGTNPDGINDSACGYCVIDGCGSFGTSPVGIRDL